MLSKKYQLIAFLITALLGCSIVPTTLAQEKSLPVEVYRKSKLKPEKKFVVKETNKEVKFSKGYTIPSRDIKEINYREYFDVQDLSRPKYDDAFKKVKEAAKAPTLKKRHELLRAAIKKYKFAQEKLAASPKGLLLKKAPRHVQFKIAQLQGIIGLEQGSRPLQEKAVAALEKFKKDHGTNCWQYIQISEMLVRLHTNLGNFEKA